MVDECEGERIMDSRVARLAFKIRTVKISKGKLRGPGETRYGDLR
jgi:hypothetical protein